MAPEMYAVDDDLDQRAGRHCAALFASRDPDEARTSLRQFGLLPARPPGLRERNGTLTLVRVDGSLLGITAAHVVTAAREADLRLMTFVNANTVIEDCFAICSDPDTGEDLDLAIGQVSSTAVRAMGKEPYVLDMATLDAPFSGTFGVAVGFPGPLKTESRDSIGVRLKMPCVRALAERQTEGDATKLLFFSEVDRGRLAQVPHLGGMSGGPVFWSDGERKVLVAILYEALPPHAPEGGVTTAGRIAFVSFNLTGGRLRKWVAAL